MAAWITHFRIADILLKQNKISDDVSFIIGNIAPDSGTLGSDKKYDPPRKILHWTSDDGKKIFYNDFKNKYLNNYFDDNRYFFCFGYLCHLITDDLWAEMVYIPKKNEYKKYIGDNNELIAKIKVDMFRADFKYLYKNKSVSYEKFKNIKSYGYQFLDYIPAEKLNIKIEEIRNFYNGIFDEDKYGFTVVKEQMVHDFVFYAADFIQNYISENKILKRNP